MHIPVNMWAAPKLSDRRMKLVSNDLLVDCDTARYWKDCTMASGEERRTVTRFSELPASSKI